MLQTDSLNSSVTKPKVFKKLVLKPEVEVKTDSLYLQHFYKSSSGNCYIFPPDSLFSEQYHAQKILIPSNNTLQAHSNSLNNKIIAHNYPFNNFSLFMLVFSFAFLAFIKVTYQKYIRQIFSSVINYHDSYKLYRDHNANIDGFFMGLNLIFAIIGSFFVFKSFQYFNVSIWGYTNFNLLLACLVIIVLMYLGRYLISKIIGLFFDKLDAFDEYLHNTFVFYKVAGLILLPLVSILMFIRAEIHVYLLITGFSIIFLLYVLSIIRGTRIMLKKDVLLLYWILYLCTLEIIPIFIAWRFIKTLT
jgi:hypothetical protein